jgi:hypothetical protein
MNPNRPFLTVFDVLMCFHGLVKDNIPVLRKED